MSDDRLWILCVHGKIESHVNGWRNLPRSGIREAIVCPGGHEPTSQELIDELQKRGEWPMKNSIRETP